MSHVLSTKFLCPYANVVDVPQNQMLNDGLLVVTAITGDDVKNQLLAASNVERLNIGAISTMKFHGSATRR